MRAYRDEQMVFEKELRAKLEPQSWECGTEEEQKRLVTQSSIIDEFLRDLRETTNSLSSDIAYLKALLLQSFAWLEETKSKNSANSTDNPRDRGDRHKIKELQRLFFYVQSQLVQATKTLDLEWVELENREKSKMKIPSLEFIYQSLKKHAEIIAKEKNIVETQLRKWKVLTRGNKASGLDRSMSQLNISSMSLAGKNNDVGAIELRCKAIESNTRSFSIEKQMKLRELLLETTPRVIKAINPSPVQDRLEATLSSLASLTPVPNVVKAKPNRISTPVAKDQTIPKISEQSPLGSLNSIVAKLGSPSTDSMLNKNPPKGLSMGNPAPFFGWNEPQTDKKQTVLPVVQAKPKQNITITLSQLNSSSPLPSNPRSQAQSEVKTITFGSIEPKAPEQATIASSDIFSKASKPPAPKDFSIAGSSFFQDSKPTLVFSAIAPTKTETKVATAADSSSFSGLSQQPAAAQETMRESVSSAFSFTAANQPPKSSSEPATSTPSMQTFSFASKPIDPPAFSFASKDSVPATQTTPQAASDLSVGFDNPIIDFNSLGLSKYPDSGLNFSEVAAAVPSGTSVSLIASQPPRPQEISATSSAGNIFGGTPKNPPASSVSSEKVAAGTPNATIFGGSTSKASMFSGSGLTASVFGASNAAQQTAPLSSGFGVAQKAPTTTSSETATSGASTIFGISGATPAAPKTSAESSTTTTFGKSSISFSSSGFGGMLGNSSTTLNFGTAVSNTTSPPAFEKTPEMAATRVFSQTPVVPATSPAAAKSPVSATTASIFGGTTGASSNNSVFGNVPAPVSSTIFGGGNSNQATPSVFETNTAPIAPFGNATSATIFGGGVQKSPSSIFSGNTATPISSPFGAATTPAAAPTPTGSPQSTSAFGQSATFGAKPVFGAQPSIFGAAKPEFSNPFGGTTFGASATPSGIFSDKIRSFMSPWS